MAGIDTAAGKAGRNEARKLRATWLNNGSLALVVAGLIQPVLGLVQQQRAFTWPEAIASFAFLVGGYMLYEWSRAVAKQMED